MESYTWIPFGGGVRRCIGASFAQMEMAAVLRGVLSRVELAALDPAPERARIHHVTLVPHRGAEALVVRRRPSPVPDQVSGNGAAIAAASPAGRP